MIGLALMALVAVERGEPIGAAPPGPMMGAAIQRPFEDRAAFPMPSLAPLICDMLLI